MERFRLLAAAGLAAAAVLAATAGALAEDAAPSHLDRVLLPVFDGNNSAWSPDSRQIAVPESKSITLRGTDGRRQRSLRGAGIGHFGFPCEECPLAWNQDGTHIQFLSHEDEYEADDWVVGSVSVDGSDEQRRSLGVPLGAAAWAPSGWPLIYIPNSRTITVAKGKLVGPSPDIWRLDSLYGKPRKLVESRAEEDDPLFSPDGTEFTFLRERERSSSLWKARSDGSGVRRLVGNLLGPSAAQWSPDGGSIALSTFSRGDRRCHLYLLGADGGRLQQIVDEEILTNRPAWTPDGNWITFSNYNGEIRRVRPDGSGLQTLERMPDKEIRALRWSPDGTHLAYTARVFLHSD
ncbi:MAG: hypothetical protein ABW065_03230 [Solirubrobacterales bacterium]